MFEAQPSFASATEIGGVEGTRTRFLGLGQGAGARFSADSFVAQQKSQAAAGAATPGY